ncbi:MAG: SDR family NAD(P)-dependent oxidoreductase [Bifidobacteriaceae bacterium]|jgi:short-subunit dehydrogenase|nr:SDR family NAD(P)-dependent oxidoreductase [Bifidobacteriaceae bacterium]
MSPGVPARGTANRFAPALLGVPLGGGGPDRVQPWVVGRTVVVTGASRGIGREVAKRLAALGSHVIGVARSAEPLAELAAAAARHGRRLEPRTVDLREANAANALAEEIIEFFGPPQLVVSCAGHSIHRYLPEYAARFHDVDRLARINFLGPVALLLPFADQMARRGSGHIVDVSTAQVDVPTPGWSAYTASKAAFQAWLASAAPELRAAGVAVTSVHLPRVATAMSAPTAGRYSVPELTVAQAADAVCRAIARRPRLSRPWWAAAAAVAAHVAPRTADALWTAALKAGLRP